MGVLEGEPQSRIPLLPSGFLSKVARARLGPTGQVDNS